ncbi:MAG: PH domain-containing protein [Verrucomicrobiota bacterium]|nr:PH domain-containing protein [Verrucomicrobiota bacterium]
MSFKITCASCGQNIEVEEEWIGREAECPSCSNQLLIAKPALPFPKPKTKMNVPSKEKSKPKQNIKAYTSNPRINKQLADLRTIDTWFTKKEIKYLPEVIRDDEIIKGLGSGTLDGNTWLIIVTNQRLLFLDKGMIYGLKQMEMDYGQISAVSHSMGFILASITVSTSGGAKKIDNIQKADAPKLSQLISDLVRQSKQPTQVVSSGTIDIASQLEKLAGLLEKGILTQEEFQSQKMKLLSQ